MEFLSAKCSDMRHKLNKLNSHTCAQKKRSRSTRGRAYQSSKGSIKLLDYTEDKLFYYAPELTFISDLVLLSYTVLRNLPHFTELSRNDVSIVCAGVRQFEEAEKRRTKGELVRQEQKHKRQLEELRARNASAVGELEQLQVGMLRRRGAAAP